MPSSGDRQTNSFHGCRGAGSGVRPVPDGRQGRGHMAGCALQLARGARQGKAYRLQIELVSRSQTYHQVAAGGHPVGSVPEQELSFLAGEPILLHGTGQGGAQR